LLLDPDDQAVGVVGEVEGGVGDLGAAVVDEGEQGLEAGGLGSLAAGELLAADHLDLVGDRDLAKAGVVVWM
jgi:hypothetical protein